MKRALVLSTRAGVKKVCSWWMDMFSGELRASVNPHKTFLSFPSSDKQKRPEITRNHQKCQDNLFFCYFQLFTCPSQIASPSRVMEWGTDHYRNEVRETFRSLHGPAAKIRDQHLVDQIIGRKEWTYRYQSAWSPWPLFAFLVMTNFPTQRHRDIDHDDQTEYWGGYYTMTTSTRCLTVTVYFLSKTNKSWKRITDSRTSEVR